MRSLLIPTLLLTSSVFAQSVVVPGANANTVGTSQLNSIIRNLNNPRTYQYGVNAAELANVPIGSVITGVSLRFSLLTTNTASWPPADVTWTTYDIWAGEATPTSGWVADPFANFVNPPQQVRTGPMVLDAGVFSNQGVAGVPNPWAEWYFDFQNPYLYLGGDLALLFSHPGSTDPALALFPETVASNAAAHGVGRVQSIYPPGTATTGSSFYVMRIHYGYGTGCAASTGSVPVLVQNGDLSGGTGGNILLTVGNTAPGSLAVMALGFTQTVIPISPTCNLFVTPDIVAFAGIANPNGRIQLPIAVAPGVLGNFHAQAAVLDFALPLGFCVSNAVSPSSN